MIQIIFGCSHVLTSRVSPYGEVARLVEDARKAGKTSYEIYRALRTNKEKHGSRCINLSEVRVALGLRS